MKIFIRADGGQGIGLGHIMRTLVLANELSKANNEILYLCKRTPKYNSGREKIRGQGIQVILINEENITEDIIAIQKLHKADILITDSYDVDEEYFNELKPHFKLNGYIDDVNKCKMNVDFLINQNINAKALNYVINIMPHTKLFLGTEYCMLRKEFKENFIEKDLNITNKNILLTLGGMDDEWNTIQILEQIKQLAINIHVVIGNAFQKELIEKICSLSRINTNILVYENANMSLLMSKCDFAISSCGLTLYELCSMEVATIGIIIAENQKEVGKTMKNMGILFKVFSVDEISKLSFKEAIEKLTLDYKFRKNIVLNQRKLINKNGAEKLVNEILSLK